MVRVLKTTIQASHGTWNIPIDYLFRKKSNPLKYIFFKINLLNFTKQILINYGDRYLANLKRFNQ